jgi:hypothetical protein
MVVAGALLGVLVAVGAGCSGGGDDTKTSARRQVDESIEITPGPVVVSSAGPPAALDDATRDQMLGTVAQYVKAATVDPLRSGGDAGDLAPLFTAAAATRATGPDRAVLVDEGLPAASSEITAKSTPIAITVLADQSGALVLASANIDLTAETRTRRGPVTIHRVGSLTLAPDAGTWRVSGFDLAVERAGKGVDAAVAATDTTGSSREPAP